MSPQETAELEKQIALHLRRLKIVFENTEFVEDGIENGDETHFLFDVIDGRILSFTNDKETGYSDVTFGSERMTMLIRISGGRNARIETSLLIDKDRDHRCSIRSVPGNIQAVVYRTE